MTTRWARRAALVVALTGAPWADLRGSEPPGFAVAVKGVTNPHAVFGVMVVPGERLPLAIVEPAAGARYRLRPDAGVVSSRERHAWEWRAPRDPGTYPVVLVEEPGGATMTLNVFVMRPASEIRDQRLNGYRIGDYPVTPSPTDIRTVPPDGFVEVQPDDLETLVSPNFRLRQFVCKQQGGFPKYLLVDPALLLKLEAVVAGLREAGIAARTLHVMSGFRTPWYNRQIKNVKYSQHQWGRAADVFVDIDGDHWMDDLNGDGRSNGQDVSFLKRLVEEMTDQPWYRPFVGGLGLYSASPRRPAFIHVDTRGRRARW